MRILILFIFIQLNCFYGFSQPSKAIVSDFSKELLPLGNSYWKLFYGKTYDQVKQSNYLGGADCEVPGSWGSSGNKEIGYGTYVCRIHQDKLSELSLSLKLYAIGTNYQLYINGSLEASAGKFGIIEDESKPDFAPGDFHFETASDTLEIALQVSNFHYRQGGIWYMPSIGKSSIVDEKTNIEIITSAFLSGSLFVLFFYFVAFYYVRTKEKSSLYFALLCLSAALRISSSGIILIKQVSSNFPWEIVVRIEFTSLVLILLFGMLYIYSMYPRDLNRKVVSGILWLQSTFAVFFSLLPVAITSYLIPTYLFVCVLLLLYFLNLIIKIMVNKRPFAIWVGGAYLITFLAGINDILHSQGIINFVYLLPTSIFLFSTIQALTITRLFSKAFRDVEELSESLAKVNQNQSSIIVERTALLEEQAAELHESNLIKDKVFSIIAHDLRAPIKSLSTVLNWVADDDLTYEELKKSLGSISKNVDMLNLTLENLLNWSRSQLTGVRSEPEIFDLRKPIQEMLELYRIQLGEKNISLQNQINERVIVYFDKNQLQLILRNLISNAIKFTYEGGKIILSVSAAEKAGYVRINVQDTGLGMSKEAIQKVFSPFEHYTTFGTKNEKGTGLGLLLCKEYIEGAGGKIGIESELNNGTKVFFEVKIEN